MHKNSRGRTRRGTGISALFYGTLLTLIVLSGVTARTQDNSVPAVTYSDIYTFQSSPDGENLNTPLVADTNGDLYGGTELGGTHDYGVIVELTPQNGSWTEQVLYSFSGPDGEYPSGVVLGPNGVLYGTAYRDSHSDNGTFFQLTPPHERGQSWTYTLLYQFRGGSDGSRPGALIVGRNGVLYGVTTQGGNFNAGTAFALSPPVGLHGSWSEKVIHHFGGANDGSKPYGAPLVQDAHGNLYGTTQFGGSAVGVSLGTVFQLMPPAALGNWTEHVLHSFTGGTLDGSFPLGGVIIGSDGALYGTTGGGGGTACDGQGCGTVFKVAPQGRSWTESVIHNFEFSDGETPFTGVVQDNQGNLYGTTQLGGQNDEGVAYQLTPPNGSGPWNINVLHNFGWPVSWEPETPLFLGSDGNLYGGAFGGSNLRGIIFKITH